MKPDTLKIPIEIDGFFDGKSHFNRDNGVLWISRHGNRACKNLCSEDEYVLGPDIISKNPTGHYMIAEMETLTWEPNEGGQYEVAIRVWNEKDKEWMGYRLVKDKLWGINTRGH